MAIPTFLAGVLNTDFRYKSTVGVVDVNTIISDLSGELVALGWTDASGVGTGPWTSPVVSSVAFITITAARISATRISWIVNDHRGLLVNNATDTRQDIEVTGNEVLYYTSKFGCIVDSNRVTPECWACGMLDQTPENFVIPRPNYFATDGPRNNAGTLAGQTFEDLFYFEFGATAYATTNPPVIRRAPVLTTFTRTTFTGALLFTPWEIAYTGELHGRVFQALIVDSGQAFGSEFTVPIDTGTTGVFKVVGIATANNARICARKS